MRPMTATALRYIREIHNQLMHFEILKYRSIFENQSYENMSLIKVGLPFFNSSMKKKIVKIQPIFDILNCALFDLKNQKESKA
jgi:hypothetical protein